MRLLPRLSSRIVAAGAAVALLASTPLALAQPAPDAPPAASPDAPGAPPPKPSPDAPAAPDAKSVAPPDAAAPPADVPPEAPAAEPAGTASKPPVAPPMAASPAEAPPAKPAPAKEDAPAPPKSGFAFGSYGRMVVSTDGKGRPGRDADIVAHGSRLDESSYVELELRRDDYWAKTGATTRVVSTLAVASPFFHYNGDFQIDMGVRNLYLEERDLLQKGLSVWVGSRMYRGDDIYLLDFWPLDNLNTMGGGVRYDFNRNRTSVALHMGLSQPKNLFFHQEVDRPAPANLFGAAKVAVLDRQRFTASLKLSHIVPLGEKAGLKAVAYGEVHKLPSGQRETDPGQFEDLPADGGWVVGAQLGAFTGERDTHLNLFVRYARGLGAYGDFSTFSTSGTTYGGPTGQLTLDRTLDGAHEFLVALGGNWEAGPVGVMLGGYFRSFRNPSPALDFEDVDEGIVVVRPQIFFGESAGFAVEGSFQAMQRGVLPTSVDPNATTDATGTKGPLTAHLWRVGFMPFLSPAGRGDYSRPQIRLIWAITARDQGARSLYPQDDVFRLRNVEHFLGLGAEWWFNSSSYGG